MAQNFFDPRSAPAKGVGGYDPLAVNAAGSDQRMGFDMLMQYLTGTSDTGTGPFSGFLESFLGPIATAAINAKGLMGGGQMPTSIDDIFGGIASRIGGGAGGAGAGSNIYDYLSGMAQNALGTKLGPGANISYDELQALLKTLNPLQTLGMDRITGSQFGRQQGDLLRQGQTPSYWDMTGQNNKKDWGDFFTSSPFYKQYYNGAQGGGAGNTQSAVVQQALANNTGAGQSQLPKLAGGGGGSGLYTP